jgi:hypothetical protein
VNNEIRFQSENNAILTIVGGHRAGGIGTPTRRAYDSVTFDGGTSIVTIGSLDVSMQSSMTGIGSGPAFFKSAAGGS